MAVGIVEVPWAMIPTLLQLSTDVRRVWVNDDRRTLSIEINDDQFPHYAVQEGMIQQPIKPSYIRRSCGHDCEFGAHTIIERGTEMRAGMIFAHEVSNGASV